jgi:hypothetical protein
MTIGLVGVAVWFVPAFLAFLTDNQWWLLTYIVIGVAFAAHAIGSLFLGD